MPISTAIINSLVNEISFPGEIKVPHGKRERRNTLTKGGLLPELKEHTAAVEIQRIYRGWRTRRRFTEVLKQKLNGPCSCSKKKETRKDSERAKSPARLRLEEKHINFIKKQPSHSVTVTSLSSYLDQYNENDIPKVPSQLTICKMPIVQKMWDPSYDLTFEDFCVRYIQNWWFQKRAHKNNLYSRSNMSEGPGITRDKAASMIQKAWRRHIDIQVYHYYRDLIHFYSRGNPKMMIKCINPKEAELLDFAAGIHLRFRLAGEKFPPNIYYKMYTYRPITDVNAFAPRDYTVGSWALPGATVKNSKLSNPNQNEDLSRWYQRQENNGWRLVSDRIFSSNDTDTLIQESNSERKFFHYSRLRRQRDVEHKRRKKKREWMTNMYKQGKELERDLTEDEIEELVSWCDDLNFDSYVSNWLELATAATLPNCDYVKDAEGSADHLTF